MSSFFFFVFANIIRVYLYQSTALMINLCDKKLHSLINLPNYWHCEHWPSVVSLEKYWASMVNWTVPDHWYSLDCPDSWDPHFPAGIQRLKKHTQSNELFLIKVIRIQTSWIGALVGEPRFVSVGGEFGPESGVVVQSRDTKPKEI